MSYKNKYSNKDFKQKNSNLKQNDNNEKFNVKIVIDLIPKKRDNYFPNNYHKSQLNINQLSINLFNNKPNNKSIKYSFFSMDKNYKNEPKVLLSNNHQNINNRNKILYNHKNEPKNMKTIYRNNISVKNNKTYENKINNIYSYDTPKKNKNYDKNKSINNSEISEKNNYIYFKKSLNKNNSSNNNGKEFNAKKQDNYIFTLNNDNSYNNYYYIKKIIKIQSVWRGREIRLLIAKIINQYKHIFILNKILNRIFFYHKKILFQKFLILLDLRKLLFSPNMKLFKKNENYNFSYIKKKINGNCRCNSVSNNRKNFSPYRRITRKNDKVNNVNSIIYLKKMNKFDLIENNKCTQKIESFISYINKINVLINFPYFINKLRINLKEKKIENKFNSFLNILESIRIKILKKYFYNYIKNQIKKVDYNEKLINICNYNDNRNTFINIININNNNVKNLLLCLEKIFKNNLLSKKREIMNKIKNYIKNNKLHNKKHIKVKIIKGNSERKKIDKNVSNILRSISHKKMKVSMSIINDNLDEDINLNSKSDILVLKLLKLMDKIELKTKSYNYFKLWKKNKNN